MDNQILKEHKIELEAKELTKPEPIKIEVVNNLPIQSITTTCGCSQVRQGKDYYTVYLSQLPEVKYFVPNDEDHFYKEISFTILRQDQQTEKVDIKIKVTKYDT